jgi:hypothetical protein
MLKCGDGEPPPLKQDHAVLETRYLLRPSLSRLMGNPRGMLSSRASHAAGGHCRCDILRCIVEGQEYPRVQALVTEPSVETLNDRILQGVAGRMNSNLRPCS